MATRVLVADDEPAMTNILRQVFEGAGYDVLEAHDGAEALDLIRRARPDVVLLDVMMPHRDGRDVSREVKSDPALADTVVILFSSMDERDVRWREAGADAYFQKVFNVMELPDRVEALRRERVRE